MGNKNFDTMDTAIFEEEAVKGSGLQDHITNHRLGTSIISALIDSGHSDSYIILRTSDTSVDTLARYHNLQNAEGLRQ